MNPTDKINLGILTTTLIGSGILAILLFGATGCGSSPLDLPLEDSTETGAQTDTDTSIEEEFCGDHIIQTHSEICDGIALGGLNCESFSFDGGQLKCDSDCQGVDISECFYGETHIPFTQIVCPENSSCFAELSDGLWAIAISKCDFEKGVDPYEISPDTIWETGCASGSNAGAVFNKVVCLQLTDNFGDPEDTICYAEVTPGWYVEISPVCELENMIKNPVELWGEYPLPEGCNPDYSAEGWDYTYCEESACFAEKHNHVVRVKPNCFEGKENYIDPSEVCQP